MAPDDVDPTAIAAGELSQGSKISRFENRYRAKDGSHRWLTWTAVPSAGLIHAVGRDMTIQKERQFELEQAQEQLRQAQKMEAVGRLAGGVAHDFNNLLQAILSIFATVEARRHDPAAIAAALAELEAHVRRGSALTRQLLVFARKDVSRPEHQDLGEVVREGATLLQRLVRENVRFAVECEPVPLPVQVDRSQLDNLAKLTGGRVFDGSKSLTDAFRAVRGYN